MLKHYLLIAIRNLLKYKTQSIVSIIGLAMGFTCFALATLWIKHEMTYENFHEDAERIFLVRNEDKNSNEGLGTVTPSPLAAYLQETFPEIEQACNVSDSKTEFKYKGITYQSYEIQMDSASMKIFPIRLVSGNTNFLVNGSKEIAITEELAGKLFGKENPIGKELSIYGQESPICAVVKAWEPHTNMPFEIVRANYTIPVWYACGWTTFIKLRKEADIKAFRKKIYGHTIEKDNAKLEHFVLTPIIQMRYNHPIREATIKFNHILLFALSGGLVILCSLFNYLTLFVSRIRMRGKEIALRKVCGSSDKHLMELFSIEYVLTLLTAIFIGMLLIELILPTFRELSEIKTTANGIYLEAIGYSLFVALLSFLISLLPIHYFRRQSLNAAIKGTEKGKGKNYFQKFFLVLQFIISIGFIFCTLVMIKQIHHLSHTDRIVERVGRASITFSTQSSEASLREELKQIPMITEILSGNHNSFIPQNGASYIPVKEWDDKPASADEVLLETIASGEGICNYYNLKLLKGTMLRDDDQKEKVMINETAARLFGWADPIGKSFLKSDSTRAQIIGVIRDFCKNSPTIPVKPMVFTVQELFWSINSGGNLLFIFREGQWQECKRRIEALIKEKHPEFTFYRLNNTEEEFNKFLQSENALIKLLDFVSIVCILISVFGIFSLVTLNCEQRRKEIAIRKVNGASVGTIIRMFFKEYLLLLCVAAAIALPVSYLIMKAWLENYVIQTTIPFWIYLILFMSLVMITITCIYWRIWKAASKNPAEVIKFE